MDREKQREKKHTGEEDTLDSSKGDETFTKGRSVVGDPLESPISLLLDARN